MDKELRLQLLRACVRDKTFLKSSQQDLSAESFPEIEEEIIVRSALQFYQNYGQPIGAMLRSEVEDEVQKAKLGTASKKKLKELIDVIQQQKIELVSVQALQDRVHKLKVQGFYEKALDQILSAHEKDQLSVEIFSDIVDKAAKTLTLNGYHSSDYFSALELEKRIKRRALQAQQKQFPSLLIQPLDEKIKMIGRGMTGLVVAPYNSGKSLFLLHIAAAYALQGLKVLYISLEDPKEEVEDRLDAAISGLPIRKLEQLPNKLKNRFLHFLKQVHGRVKFVDGTDGGWTISRIEKAWEAEKQSGFIADVCIVDYDDEVECEKVFKGDSARRMEFAEIYRQMRRAAVKTDAIWWIAAQAGRQAENKKVVSGKDIAEDISKARKVFLAIGIGGTIEEENTKHLFVIRHKLDRSKFGVDIQTRFSAGMFYDAEATMAMQKNKKKKLAEA